METTIYYLGFRVLGFRDPKLDFKVWEWKLKWKKEMVTEVYIEVYRFALQPGGLAKAGEPAVASAWLQRRICLSQERLG